MRQKLQDDSFIQGSAEHFTFTVQLCRTSSTTNKNPVQHRFGAGSCPGRWVSSVLCAVRGVQGEEDVGFAPKQTPELLQELAALRVGVDVFDTDGLGEAGKWSEHAGKWSFCTLKECLTQISYSGIRLDHTRCNGNESQPIIALWSTDHGPQDEVLQTCFSRAVGRRLSVSRLRLGSLRVRRPPNAGQQPGRSAHRVVAGTGHLLVPRLGRNAGEQQEKADDRQHESAEHLQVQMWRPSLRVPVASGSVLKPAAVFIEVGDSLHHLHHHPHGFTDCIRFASIFQDQVGRMGTSISTA